MKIRLANENDLDGLVALQELLDEHVARSSSRLWRATQRRRDALGASLRADSARVFVAEEGRKLVGYISGKVERRTEGPPYVVGNILWVFVREEWRNHGVGAALVDALLGFFDSNKIEDITLRYAIGNEEAKRFWRKLGFTPLICTANTRPAELRHKLKRLLSG